jgi:L-serine dehydratase
MPHSVFEIFKLGVGPSSSHTMGPMSAAATFAAHLAGEGVLTHTARVVVRLYGSLALTGLGHATDRAILAGLSGMRPDGIDPDAADAAVAAVREGGRLKLGAVHDIGFNEAEDLVFLQRERLPHHPNGMRFTALNADGAALLEHEIYSIGGGAILDAREIGANRPAGPQTTPQPYSFINAAELLTHCAAANLSIAEVVLANECTARPEAEVRGHLRAVHGAMDACIERGMRMDGVLPGGLKVKRRAKALLETLKERQERALTDPLTALDWVNLWALAVNEENAAGGRVVTAPTNGAAGIVPAVLRYYMRMVPGANAAQADVFLLTATAIGALFKRNASISGADVGCQGEVGVACSMAAGGLAAVMGGTPAQVENAAEIGMEHNLGLTCDPIKGLVQVPCIERNAVGAVKAIEAARLALVGDGDHRVSLDQVIETMRRTGADMSEKYKETALGGLAVNVVEC